MAFTTPGTVVAGDVYTAAAHNVIAEDLRVLGGVAVPARSTITNTTTTTTSATFADTGLSVTITPTSTSSLVEIAFTICIGASSLTLYRINLLRGATNIAQGANCTLGGVVSSADVDVNTMMFIDSPATTSATTYKLQWQRDTAGVTLYINRRGDVSNDVNPISYLQAREIIQP